MVQHMNATEFCRDELHLQTSNQNLSIIKEHIKRHMGMGARTIGKKQRAWSIPVNPTQNPQKPIKRSNVLSIEKQPFDTKKPDETT